MNRKAWISVAVVFVAVAVVIAAAMQTLRPAADLPKHPQPPLKLAAGMSWAPGNSNMFIAKHMGYFRDLGLDISLERYASGQLALIDLLTGKLDLAVVAETPVVFAALRGERFYLLATTYASDEVSVMIARRDRGIATPPDLAGKRLGTVFGTNGEFVQDTILAMNKIDPQSIVRVNLAPARAGDALVAGEVDALTIWPPHSLAIRKRLGESAVVFSAKAIYSTTYDLIARDGLVKDHPEALRRLLAALLRADAFARANPARAVEIVAQALDLEAALVKDAVNAPALTVALNHSLIIAMEDQARWAIKRGLVETTAVPNFLEWIHTDALAAVKPEAVSVIK